MTSENKVPVADHEAEIARLTERLKEEMQLYARTSIRAEKAEAERDAALKTLERANKDYRDLRNSLGGKLSAALKASAAMASRQNALIDTLRDELAKEKAKSAKMVGALEACVASLERADTAEGVCCCGDNMEGHGAPMNCGHGPVDMGDYYASKALEAASAAIAAYEVKT